MTEHETSRTLVKSPPELWAECSDAASLARHLDGTFGEIRITRREPETSVAWEGENASGTVRIEPSAWGTRVTLTARVQGLGTPVQEGPPVEAVEPPVPAEGPGPAEPLPASSVEPSPEQTIPAPRPIPPGWLARLRIRFRSRTQSPAVVPAPAPARPAPVPEPGPAPPEPEPSGPDPAAALAAALDSLGQAHHRPFSRS